MISSTRRFGGANEHVYQSGQHHTLGHNIGKEKNRRGREFASANAKAQFVSEIIDFMMSE
jgi:hypothetical protein